MRVAFAAVTNMLIPIIVYGSRKNLDNVGYDDIYVHQTYEQHQLRGREKVKVVKAPPSSNSSILIYNNPFTARHCPASQL